MPRKFDKAGKTVNSNKPKLLQLDLPDEQKRALELYQENDIIFLVGPAGTGKTFLSMAFAVQDILSQVREKIIISRPVVEAGENLGFLPGDLDEKIYPYMLPLYDCLEKLCGKDTPNRRFVEDRYELAPLAFMRGRTFDESICILDEAQNCSKSQLKLFLTRLGKFSKMIVTGDPTQNDLGYGKSGLQEVLDKLEGVPGIGIHYFTEEAIVRHPLVAQIVKRI
jgi:phosphate starvation-inducible PhoH-like protein